MNLSTLKTPKTLPKVDRGEMHPELLHRSTVQASGSGGANKVSESIPSGQDTPSKTRLNAPSSLSSATFDFKFGSDSQLSSEARKLMDNVREEAARIKAQMQAEKESQQRKDEEAETVFNGVNASSRKIAKPKGRAGRFSDLHLAQFKKMDSIANHPSAFRGKPGFAQPTTQSLKRSGSKAGLDEIDRPRTAGKGASGRLPTPYLSRPTSVSPFKSIPTQSERVENTSPAKRARHSDSQDVSASRSSAPSASTCRSNHARPISSSLLSPTKASLARAAASQIPIASPDKASKTSRTQLKSLRSADHDNALVSSASHGLGIGQTLSRSPGIENVQAPQGLPPSADEATPSAFATFDTPQESKKQCQPAALTPGSGFASRLPKLSGLKSILRSGRKADPAESAGHSKGTPKRPNTATSAQESVKKVDFTPSVKSRYAVKLAATSPTPARLPLTPGHALGPVVPYDPAAYILPNEEDDDAWEDAESEIEYPALPEPSSSPAPSRTEDVFAEKAKTHNRRESKEFKSIFTTLHHPSRPSPPATLTSVNTIVNKTGPTIHANKVMRSPSNVNFSRSSPATIRRVRSSGMIDVVKPFEDADVKTMPHGLPGKKRRHESLVSAKHTSTDEGGKENHRMSIMPSVPGGWKDSPQLSDEDEGEKRGGKRVRVEESTKHRTPAEPMKGATKKPRQSSAREMAKNNAKERKGKGILSLSRLNMLSRPKQRG